MIHQQSVLVVETAVCKEIHNSYRTLQHEHYKAFQNNADLYQDAHMMKREISCFLTYCELYFGKISAEGCVHFWIGVFCHKLLF